MQILTNFTELGQLLGGQAGNFQGLRKPEHWIYPQRMTAVYWINFHIYGSIPFSSEANLNFTLNCKDRSNHQNNFSRSTFLEMLWEC